MLEQALGYVCVNIGSCIMFRFQGELDEMFMFLTWSYEKRILLFRKKKLTMTIKEMIETAENARITERGTLWNLCLVSTKKGTSYIHEKLGFEPWNPGIQKYFSPAAVILIANPIIMTLCKKDCENLFKS